ncbi:hypothetical protein FRC10_002562 [Ceratobasidium sp. 414]|nr:hypothetical protein FRC10_002562 [Ceratobasidium sp. 414]
MSPRPHTSSEWRELVQRPEPITDQIWDEIYLSLVLLLWSNRAYDQAMERKKRRMDRVARLYDLITEIRENLLPLFTIIPAIHPTVPQSHLYATRVNYRPITVNMPFPSMAELMDWRFIKHLIDRDTTIKDFEAGFVGLRHKFVQAVTEWRNRVDQDLLSLRNAGHNTGANGSGSSTHSMAKGKYTMTGITTLIEAS